MVSLLTALTIQANGAEVAIYQGKNEKYGFEIYSIIREHYRPQLSSEPVYDSKKIAKEKGKEILTQIQDLDLDAKRKELSGKLGDAAPIVQKIVDESKK